MFDDMSLPIKFNIEENDRLLDDIVQCPANEFLIDLADFYSPEFDIMDNFVITGQDMKTNVFGPMVVDKNLEDQDYIVVDHNDIADEEI